MFWGGGSGLTWLHYWLSRYQQWWKNIYYYWWKYFPYPYIYKFPQTPPTTSLFWLGRYQQGKDGASTGHTPCSRGKIWNQQSITSNAFWTEDNHRSIYISPSYVRAVVVSNIIRDTNIVENTVFELVLRKDSISGLTFYIRKRQSIVLNAF